MGTLFDQKPREYGRVSVEHLQYRIEDLKKVAENQGITLDQVIKISELALLDRQIDAYVANGDIHDEQMAGFGELLQGISNNLERLVDHRESLSE